MKVSRGKSLDRFYILPRVFIHRIHDDDPARTYHSHPWDGVSFIFGCYWEEFMDGTRRLRVGINFLKAERHHRVILRRKGISPYPSPVWTLFVHGKKKENHKWSIRRPGEEVFEPWRGAPGLKNYEAEAMP
jgi:hypothetical protein